MCLAVPAKLTHLAGQVGIADLHGNRVEISTALVPDVLVGDWVLLHAGFAIQKLDGDEAQATWAVLEDVAKASAKAEGRRMKAEAGADKHESASASIPSSALHPEDRS